jgi:Fe-S oxidoreductase
VVLEATVELVPEPPARALVALGYASMAEAADAVPGLLAACGPGAGGALTACEGLDSRIVDLVRARPGHAVPPLPRGTGWLLAEVTGDSAAHAEARARRVVAAAAALDHRLVSDASQAAALWRIRESGAGLAARSLARPAHAGWEDAAVPPEHLGAWLRDFEALLAEQGLAGVPYGHFGDGCVHVRIDVPFAEETAAGRPAAGVEAFRRFLLDSATALAAYGGSLSGEHGDGRARSELLPLMYDARSLALFARAKRVCDPDGVLNPGVLVDPAALDADLRPPRPRREPPLALRMVDDASMGAAVHRCTGVGACVAPGPELGRAPAGPAVMCPSWVATREEKDSTRGRARVLQEALDAGPGGDALVRDLADPAVHEALDLCLACKGCARDCPTGVDMATYKAEALHQRWRARLRPRSHYALGWLPTWARLAAPFARVVNAAAAGPGRRLAAGVAGVDGRRSLPRLSTTTARREARRAARVSRRRWGPSDRVADLPDVWIWADTFTDHFAAENAAAATEVLAAAGLEARVIDAATCCGLTLVTTGQLDAARRVVTRTVATLAPYAASGVPVLGLEPSCVATLRDDARRLVADPRVAEVAGAVRTLAEMLDGLGVPLPDLSGVEVVAQPHCHHASVLGWEVDERLLTAAGARVTRVGGCCGLAGSFGMERGHHEVSVAVAETRLLPAVRAAGPDAVVLADGLSCRHQLEDLAGVPAMHLARLLASRLTG